MKVILTGTTGFIGKEVLQQCVSNPAISDIVVLSRKPVEWITHSKIKVIIMKDFTVYDDAVLESLTGAEACIWSVTKFSPV